MNLPFTPEQFLLVFEHYNRAVWPFQIVLNGLGLIVLVLSGMRFAASGRILCGILAFFWVWIGLAYHIGFFSSINPIAKVFGALNIIQAILFAYYGVFNSRLSFQFKPDVFGMAGAMIVLYAMVVYPLLGYSFGHIYPKAPTFGLPCPTTIFTFGLLLWTNVKVPKLVLVIPFLWSIVGFSAAVSLGIREDNGLLFAGIASVGLLILRDKNLIVTGNGVEKGEE